MRALIQEFFAAATALRFPGISGCVGRKAGNCQEIRRLACFRPVCVASR